MFEREQQQITEKISYYCQEHGLALPSFDWKWIPFSGSWGISTSFFQVAAAEARQGKKIVVPKRAQEIAQQVADYLAIPDGFSRVEAVNGYLNLYYETERYAQHVVASVLQEKEFFGRSAPNNQQVMVEFSQPNTHKAFHVGHLRNVILGDSICRLLNAAGYKVVRANYIGDIGLHVIKWLWVYLKNHNGETPGADRTRWMGEIYSEADALYDDPDVKAEVKALFGKWDQREPEIVALWKQSRGWSLEGFDQVYQRLGVEFNRIYFESDVEDSGKVVVDELIEKGLAKDERPEGAVIIPLDEILGLEEKYRVLVILRSDGTSLYSTKDLALAAQKFDEYQLDKSIYVIDVRQSLYMQQIFKTIELLGHSWADKCHHLAYEIVNLPGNVTMSSRDGTVVLFDDLINEATRRALVIVKEKNPELASELQQNVAEAVALGAIKYSMLSRDSTKIVTFDWESALDFNGQAAPYIQYAAVRANSILRKSGIVLGECLVPSHTLRKEEVELIDLITRLPAEVKRAAEEYKPLLIANLSFEIAKAFSNFYRECPVLQAPENEKNFRIYLVAAAKQALSNALNLLGIKSPDVM